MQSMIVYIYSLHTQYANRFVWTWTWTLIVSKMTVVTQWTRGRKWQKDESWNGTEDKHQRCRIEVLRQTVPDMSSNNQKGSVVGSRKLNAASEEDEVEQSLRSLDVWHYSSGGCSFLAAYRRACGSSPSAWSKSWQPSGTVLHSLH